MPVGARFHEGIHRRVGRVVAEDGGQRVHEHRLAVRARAVQKKQRMLSRRAGECVTDHSLQVALLLFVATRDLVEELTPDWAVTPGRGRGDFRHPVSTVMWTLPAGLEIDHTARGVEQPGVGIPLVGGGGMTPIGACEPLQASHRATAGEFGAIAAYVAPVIDTPPAPTKEQLMAQLAALSAQIQALE